MENETMPVFHQNDTNVTSCVFNNFLKYKTEGTDHAKFVINAIIVPVVVLIGVVGNVLSIIIFRKEKKRGAAVVFIVGLAVSDIFFLTLKLIYCVYAVGHIFFVESFRYVRPNSVVFVYISLCPYRCSTLFIIFISLERLTAVWFPFQLRTVWTKTRARYISSVIVVSLIILTIVKDYEVLMFSLTEDIPKHGKISTQAESARFHSYQRLFFKTLSVITNYLLDIIPLCLVMLLNITLIVGIKMSFQVKITSTKSLRRNIERRTTRTLLTLSILYCILCGPFQIYGMLVVLRIIKTTEPPFLLTEIFKMLSVLNSVINFIVYGVTDQSLRKKYYQLVKCSNSEDNPCGEQNSTTEGPIPS